MDRVLQLIHISIPVLNLITAGIILLKGILIFLNRGFDVPAVIASLFRIYSFSELNMTSDNPRQLYMKMNNILNYFVYCWMLIAIIHFVIFKSLF